MIKQTRGALTMLLSVYRSVLKNAYLKNFAAVALAASVGVASADTVITGYSPDAEHADNVTVTTDAKNVITADDTEAAAFAKKVTVAGESAVTLTITGTAEKSATLTANEVEIGKNGIVSLVGSDAGANIAGLKDTPAESEGALPANITLKDSTSKLSTTGKSSVGNVTLEDGSATFEGTATVNGLKATKGTVTVGSSATVEITEGLTIGDDVSLVNNGTSLTVKKDAQIGALKDGSKLGTAVFEGDANFTAANMSIADSDNLTFKGNATFEGNVINNTADFSVAAEKTAKFAKALTNLATMNVTGTLDVLGDLVNGRAAVGELDGVGAATAEDATLNVGDATLANVNNANGTIEITKKATVSGAFSNGTAAVAKNVDKGIHEVTEADGIVTVAKDATVTFNSNFANNTNASTLTVKAGTDASKKKTTNVTFSDAVVNKGKIDVEGNSVVKFEKSLNNSGTLKTASALDFTGNKLTNTGTIEVDTNGKVTTEFNNDLGLTAENPTAKVINNGELNIKGTATVKQDIFTDSDSGTAGKIYNGGTLSVDKLVVSNTDADITLANAGKLTVGELEISKKLAVDDGETLTVTKSITTKANADGDKVIEQTNGALNLENVTKSEGFLNGFNTVALDAVKGLWNFGGAAVSDATIGDTSEGAKASTVTGIGELSKATIKNASVTAGTVKASGSDVQLTNNSTLTVGNVTASSGSGAAIKATDSTVKITGKYTAVSGGLVADLTGSTLELDATPTMNGSGTNETIKGDKTSTLVINGVEGKVKIVKDGLLSNPAADEEDATVRTLADVYHSIGIKSGTGHYEGIIKGLTYDTNIEELRDGKITVADIGAYSTVASSTDAFATAQVIGAGTVGKVLNVGSLEIDTDSTSNINEDVTLNKAAANGNFISVKGKTGDEAIAGATIAVDKTLTLNGDGTIGAITAGTAQKGTLVANGNKISAGDIGATSATLGTLEVKSGELTAKAVYADTTKVEGNLVADSLTAATATIYGSLTLKKDSNVATSGILTAPTLLTGANSSVSVDKIDATTSATLSGSVSASEIKTPTLTIGAAAESGVVTVGTLSNTTTAVNVNNGLLKVGENATGVTLTVKKAGSASFDKDLTLANAAQTIEGELKVAGILTNGANKMTVGSVGANGATGSVYADTLLGTGGIFVDPDYGQRASGVASMHLDSAATPGFETTTQDIVVGKNAFVAVGVSSEAQARSVLSSLGLTDANGSFREDGVNNAFYTDALVKLAAATQLEIASANTTGTASGAAGQITLGDKSAVVIGKNAAAQSVKDGKAVLTADKAGTAGVIAAGKSTVIFAGNATKQDIKDVKVFGNAGTGNQVFADADEAAKVSVQLSPLYNEAKLTVDGGITDITVNRGYINKALYNASLPVKNLVAEVADTAVTGDGVGSDFIMDNALVDGGANIESAARLATFGGAYQAAAAAVNTGIDAAQARLGLGIDNSAEVKGEDISVWANAVYKNTESDSFEAQGANYGADLDLTSLVIGADYNMTEGSKVGAYATFGTGDVDGKGAGHNVKNDVDTYGFGIYGSAKLASGVSILSDVGYTVAQNEFKGIVNADADMKVFTAGANVKYTFNTQVADISPFVGARYTSFNLESYAVKSAKGIVAYTDADTAHIFSIPVGFDLSKQITAGEWNVKPAFTAKVTFNTGDKTVSSSTQFTGVKNTLNLDAEVMDDVTYSVGASVSAAKGAATFGAGLSYTGSSETNELSAQIGARYTF